MPVLHTWPTITAPDRQCRPASPRWGSDVCSSSVTVACPEHVVGRYVAIWEAPRPVPTLLDADNACHPPRSGAPADACWWGGFQRKLLHDINVRGTPLPAKGFWPKQCVLQRGGYNELWCILLGHIPNKVGLKENKQVESNYTLVWGMKNHTNEQCGWQSGKWDIKMKIEMFLKITNTGRSEKAFFNYQDFGKSQNEFFSQSFLSGFLEILKITVISKDLKETNSFLAGIWVKSLKELFLAESEV